MERRTRLVVCSRSDAEANKEQGVRKLNPGVGYHGHHLSLSNTHTYLWAEGWMWEGRRMVDTSMRHRHWVLVFSPLLQFRGLWNQRNSRQHRMTSTEALGKKKETLLVWMTDRRSTQCRVERKESVLVLMTGCKKTQKRVFHLLWGCLCFATPPQHPVKSLHSLAEPVYGAGCTQTCVCCQMMKVAHLLLHLFVYIVSHPPSEYLSVMTLLLSAILHQH